MPLLWEPLAVAGPKDPYTGALFQVVLRWLSLVKQVSA